MEKLSRLVSGWKKGRWRLNGLVREQLWGGERKSAVAEREEVDQCAAGRGEKTGCLGENRLRKWRLVQAAERRGKTEREEEKWKWTAAGLNGVAEQGEEEWSLVRWEKNGLEGKGKFSTGGCGGRRQPLKRRRLGFFFRVMFFLLFFCCQKCPPFHKISIAWYL